MLCKRLLVRRICLAVTCVVVIASGQVPLALSGMSEAPGRTAVIGFHVADELTHVWVLSSRGVRASYSVSITRAELRARVIGFLDSVTTAPHPGEESAQYLRCLEQGRDLYDLLLGPGEPHFRDAENVVIVPSDVLWYLPFAALYRCRGCDGRQLLGGRFWIEDQAISLASSLDMAFSMMGLTIGPGLRSALVIAADCDAMFPGAQEEAETVAALFADSTVLRGTEATESRTKELLGARRYSVLHSTVGSLHAVSGNPLLSGIALCGGVADQGMLNVAEILSLRVQAGLLVLGGSMWPPPIDMDGAIAIALDALRASGIASVVLSLGAVDNASAPWFMGAFYRALQAGLSRAEALRQAQLALLRSDFYRHPYYWAPFVLYGDWR